MSKILFRTLLSGILAGIVYVIFFILHFVPVFENAQFFSIFLFTATITLLYSTRQRFGAGKYLGLLLLICIFYPVIFPFRVSYLQKVFYYGLYFSTLSFTPHLWRKFFKNSTVLNNTVCALDILITGICISSLLYPIMGYSVQFSVFFIDTALRFTCIAIGIDLIEVSVPITTKR